MKKIIVILSFVFLLVIIGFYAKQKLEFDKMVKANVEVICYQEENRYTPEYLKEDRVSKEETRSNLKKVIEVRDEIAVKYGFKSGDDMARYMQDTWDKKKIEKMMNKSEKKVKETCSPDYEVKTYY